MHGFGDKGSLRTHYRLSGFKHIIHNSEITFRIVELFWAMLGYDYIIPTPSARARVLVWVIVLGTAFHIVAVVAPYWTSLSGTHTGIWKTCSDISGCSPLSEGKELNERRYISPIHIRADFHPRADRYRVPCGPQLQMLVARSDRVVPLIDIPRQRTD